MSVSGRSQAQEERLSASINQLTKIMTEIRNCPDIDCLDREIAKLVVLTVNNEDLWNWQEQYPDDYIVLGLRQTIFTIPNLIETNPNFDLDFSRLYVSDQYGRIRNGIETIFGTLHMDIEVTVKMNVSQDAALAAQLDREINSLEYQQQEEEIRRTELEQQLQEQREREARIDEMLEKARRELEQVRLREREEEDKMISRARERGKEEEEEFVDAPTYSGEISEGEFPEDDEFPENGDEE